MRKFLITIANLLPERWFVFVYFVYRVGYIPNFDKPRSLNEKLNYIRIYRTLAELRSMVCDRIRVREYVKKMAPGCDLIEVLWQGDRLDSAAWAALPDKFVLKANHGSGMVKIVRKSTLSLEEAIALGNAWMHTDYSARGREWFYEDVPRLLVAEEFIDAEGVSPPDFKFFCCNGVVVLVQVDLDRESGHVRNLYDRNFNQLDARLRYPKGYAIDPPGEFFTAVSLAEQLSSDFDFIRVDLYLHGDKVYFGELTNLPENATGRFYPESLDFELGQSLELVSAESHRRWSECQK